MDAPREAQKLPVGGPAFRRPFGVLAVEWHRRNEWNAEIGGRLREVTSRPCGQNGAAAFL
jgi:hypothetical protein